MRTQTHSLKTHATHTYKIADMFSASMSNFEAGWFTCTELVQDKVLQDRIEELARSLVPILSNIRYRLSLSLHERERVRARERARARERERGSVCVSCVCVCVREREREREREQERERKEERDRRSKQASDREGASERARD